MLTATRQNRETGGHANPELPKEVGIQNSMQGLSRFLKGIRAFPPGERSRVVRALLAERLLRGVSDDLRMEIVSARMLQRAGGSIRFDTAESSLRWRPKGGSTDVRLSLRRQNSDIRVFHQIALADEYSALAEAIQDTCSDIEQPTILDAGANIGLASIALAARFPAARIVAVEPEPGNVARIRKHLETNDLKGRIQVVAGALWPVTTRLVLRSDFRDRQAWAFRTVPMDAGSADEISIPAFSCADILRETGLERFDVLKIDVEGAERELLLDGAFVRNHLTRARCIAIEVHPEFIPERTVLRLLARHRFVMRRSGEYFIGCRSS